MAAQSGANTKTLKHLPQAKGNGRASALPLPHATKYITATHHAPLSSNRDTARNWNRPTHMVAAH
eukprot:4113021-Prymnesium_polylepis.1